MAVIPINLARVSQNLRSFNLQEAVRRNELGLFQVQNQLATGLRVQKPSDDPLQAAAAGAMDRRLELIEQLERNLLHANNALVEGESAMLGAVELLMQVEAIAAETVGDTLSAGERQALSVVVDSVLGQLVAVGNRRYLGAYLFSGDYGGGAPFGLLGDGVMYRGDAERALAIVDTDLQQDSFTFSGQEFFSAVSSAVQGVVDLNPALTTATRVSELRGTTGQGVELGRIVISDGTQDVPVDLSGADTVGDLLDKLNAELGPGIRATLDAQCITLSAGVGAPAQLTISDVGGGQTARDLGLTGSGVPLPVGGADLNPRLTARTRLADLSGGGGLDTADGLTIRNGTRSATLDFSRAETVEDILNIMNHADVGVWARIAADGNSIEVLNRVSGSDLRIEENGGRFATALGVRSLHAGTPLASLNDGVGVERVPGADLRILTADGTTFEVDLDGAETLQDVITLLNAQGGGAITAGLAGSGNGLVITDNTVGAASLRIERANLSPALDGLGLDVPATGGTLVGRDVNPIRVDNSFTALRELRTALQRDDTRAIARAGERLENALKRMREVQGRMAAHTRAMAQRTARVENEVTAARILRSDVRDADLAQTVVRFQQLQNALQANLSTASRVMNLSLIDFLR